MNNRLEELLKKSKPSNVENKKHKETLRRELLNSKHFEKKSGLKVFLTKEIILGLSAVVILVIVFSTNIFKSNNAELDSILSGLTTNYAGFTLPGMTSNYNSQLDLYNKKNEPINFTLEQTIDYSDNNYHSLVKDVITGETLYEIMLLDGEKYEMRNPKIKFLNTDVNRRGKMIFLKKENTIDLKDSITITIQDQENANHRNFLHSAYLSVERSILTHNEMKLNYKPQTIHEINPETNFTEYLKTNPYDIYNSLVSADSIEFVEKIQDNEKYNVVRLVKPMSRREFKAILIKLDNDSLKTDEMLDKIIQGDSSYLEWILTSNDTQNFSSKNFDIHLPKKVMTVYISNDYNINKCRFSIKRNEAEVNLASVSFENHTRKPLTKDSFNPKHFNLVKVDNM